MGKGRRNGGLKKDRERREEEGEGRIKEKGGATEKGRSRSDV